MDEKQVKIKYKPREQFRSFHNRKQRWSVLVCHRRAGKTVATLNDLIRGAVNECKPEGRYAFIFPQRNQAKDTAWRYLRRYAEPLLAKPPNESELRVDLVNGSMIRLYGADNPDALRGPYLDGVVLDEFADMKPEVWHAPAELADLRREMGEDQYLQEFECSFEAAIKGAFYAEEMRAMLAEERIRPIEIEREARVHTAWDLGVSDSTAIWFVQCVARERRLVDYYEGSGVGLDHYAQVLHDKRIKHGFKYGDHYFPHDIKIREFSSGRSRLQSLAALGIDAIAVPLANVLDGIHLTRRMLGRTWIDCNRCERGIEALRQYRREYDDRLKDWRKNALHDWTSHAADALRTFACDFDDGPVGSNYSRQRGRQGEPPPRGTFWSA
jgi:phage terminase large subunit